MAGRNYKSVTELFSASSAAVRRNLGPFIFVSVLSLLSLAWQIGSDIKDKTHGSAWSSVARNSIFGTNSDYPHLGSGIILVLLFIAGIILSMMTTILQQKAASKEIVTINEVWEKFKNVWLGLIGVVILTAILIGGSFLLLIVPGIIVLPRLIMAPIVYLDQNTGVMEALNKSWDMTKGEFGSIWVVILFGIVLAIPNIVPFIGPIVSWILALLYSVALPLRYYEIKKAHKA